MPFPRHLTPLQAGKNTRNLTNRNVHRQVRDGIEVDFVQNLFYAKAAGRQVQHVNNIEQLFPYAGTNQGYYRASNGLLVPSVNNVPRIEYDSSNAVQGLLEEISRANLLLQSHDQATTWIKSQATVAANSVAGPDGVQIADTLIEDAAGTFHLTRQDVAGLAANVRYTFSVFVKAAGRNYCRLQLSNTAEANGAFVNVDLTNGTGNVTAFGTGSAQTYSISSYINGWYRIELTCIVDAASTTLRSQILLSSALGTVNYAGDGVSGIYLWGAQLELGGHATSCIPTTTVPVTRTSETFTRVIGNEITQGVGTFVVEYRTNNRLTSTFATACSMDDNSTNNRLFMFRNNVGTRTAGGVSGGVSQFSSAGGDDGSAFRKCVMVYSTAGYRNFMNGALIGSVGVSLVPTVTRLRLGNSAYGADYLNGHIRRFKYFPRVLTDAEAIAETV